MHCGLPEGAEYKEASKSVFNVFSSLTFLPSPSRKREQIPEFSVSLSYYACELHRAPPGQTVQLIIYELANELVIWRLKPQLFIVFIILN